METVIGTAVDTAAELLKQGKLVAIPTETVYGLAADALNPDAVLSIYTTKERPAFNPLIVHVHAISEFERYAGPVPDQIVRLAARFCPGPLTFVLPKKAIIPDIVTGGGSTVALRIPRHPLTLDLLRSSGLALAAPSANPFGYISPVTAQHVFEGLSGKIPYVLDGGPCDVGVESTVVMMQDDELVVLRAGGVSMEELRSVVTTVRMEDPSSADLKSPGRLKSHYAPSKEFILGPIEELLELHQDKRVALLTFQSRHQGHNISRNEVLSAAGNPEEAARNLFSAMRRLDASDADIILAERVPDHGLGVAINDRLERAAADRSH